MSFIDSFSPIGNVSTLLDSLFNKKQVYGADFPFRRQKLQEYLSARNLSGDNLKYIDQSLLDKLLFINTGWQNEVQAYLTAVQVIVENRESDFTPQWLSANPLVQKYIQPVKDYINKINFVENPSLTSGLGVLSTSGNTQPFVPKTSISLAGFSNLPLILLIGAGAFIGYQIIKTKR